MFIQKCLPQWVGSRNSCRFDWTFGLTCIYINWFSLSLVGTHKQRLTHPHTQMHSEKHPPPPYPIDWSGCTYWRVCTRGSKLAYLLLGIKMNLSEVNISFRVEIMHSDQVKVVKWLATSYQKGLFQNRAVMLLSKIQLWRWLQVYKQAFF